MRLSDFAPRVNNVRVPSGVGDTSCPAGYVLYGPTNTCTQTPAFRLQKVLQDYLTAASLGQYGNPPPSVSAMAGMLGSEAANICAETFIPCDGSIQGLVDSATQEYSAWLAGYVAPVQSNPDPNPNALNNNAPGGPSITPSVTLNGSNFKVGDSFQVVVTGPPNQPVSVLVAKDGVYQPVTQIGATDSSGRLVVSGTFTSASIGNWTEQWYVGNTGNYNAGGISFTVAASALQPPVTKPPVTSDQVLNNQTQGGSQSTANGTSGSNTSGTTSPFDWLTKPISDTIPIPLWGAIAGGVVALMVMKD